MLGYTGFRASMRMISQQKLQRLRVSSSGWLDAVASHWDGRSRSALRIDSQHVRMFMLSHLFGPFIGLTLALLIAALGFPLDYRLAGFVALVCLFWLYPAALACGADYRSLSILSLQHLTLTTLWASHAYGGLTSPFLLWLAVVPLLAFLYCAPERRLWLVLIAMLAGNVALYWGSTLLVSPPTVAGGGPLRWLSAVSLLAAFAYVAMMAAYFGRVVESRDEMALQAERHLAAAVALDARARTLRSLSAAKASSLARIVRECRAPIDEIVASSRTMIEVEAREQPGADAADLRSIDDAARHLSEVIETIADYAGSRLPTIVKP
jgi:hypothetical protein